MSKNTRSGKGKIPTKQEEEVPPSTSAVDDPSLKDQGRPTGTPLSEDQKNERRRILKDAANVADLRIPELKGRASSLDSRDSSVKITDGRHNQADVAQQMSGVHVVEGLTGEILYLDLVTIEERGQAEGEDGKFSIGSLAAAGLLAALSKVSVGDLQTIEHLRECVDALTPGDIFPTLAAVGDGLRQVFLSCQRAAVGHTQLQEVEARHAGEIEHLLNTGRQDTPVVGNNAAAGGDKYLLASMRSEICNLRRQNEKLSDELSEERSFSRQLMKDTVGDQHRQSAGGDFGGQADGTASSFNALRQMMPKISAPRFSGEKPTDPLDTSGCFSAWMRSNAPILEYMKDDFTRRSYIVSLLDNPARKYMGSLSREERENVEVLIARLKSRFRPVLMGDKLMNHISEHLVMNQDASFTSFLVRFRNACEMREFYTDLGAWSEDKKVDRLYNALPLDYRQHVGHKFGRYRPDPVDDRFTVNCTFEELSDECEIYSLDKTNEKRQLQNAQKIVGRQTTGYEARKKWSDKFVRKEKKEVGEENKEPTEKKVESGPFKCVYHATNDHSGFTCWGEKRRIRNLGLQKAVHLIKMYNPSTEEIAEFLPEKSVASGEDLESRDGDFDDLDGGLSDNEEHVEINAVQVGNNTGFPPGGLF